MVEYENYNRYGAGAGGEREEGQHDAAYPTYKGYGAVGDQRKERDETEYPDYAQRWVVLAALSLISCVNNWIWITWSPLMPDIAKYWDVPSSNVDDLSAVFMYVSVALCFPVIWFLYKFQLRMGLLVSGTLNFVGCIVRYCGYDSYQWVYYGTIPCAACQTMALALPPMLGTFWFKVRERGLATSIVSFSYQLGATFGLAGTLFADFQAEDEREGIKESSLKFYLALQLILSGFVLLFIVLGVRSNRPPKPPSEAATKRETPSYVGSIQKLFGSVSGVMFFIVYGMAIGGFYTFKTFLAQFLVYNEEAATTRSHDWSKKEVGYVGLTLNLVGQIGSLIVGAYLDKTKQYRGITLVLLFISFLAMVGFLLLRQSDQKDMALTHIDLAFLGFFLAPVFAVGFEYATAICYPADDGVIAGLMNAATQLGAWALIGVGGQMSPVGNGFVGILAGTLLCSILFMSIFVRAKSKRPGEL